MDDNPAADVQEEQKDRTTEQFEKLTASNSNLKAENEQLKEQLKGYQTPTNQVPNANQYSNLNQQQVNDVFAGMVDQNGFLDGNKLSAVLNDMNRRAQEAETRAQNAEKSNQALRNDFNNRAEEDAKKEVYRKYPQLNPDNKEEFDPKMYRLVYNELAAKAKAGTMPSDKDYMSAADQAFDDLYEGRDMNQKEQQQKKEKEEQKQQINAVRPVSTVQQGYYSNTEENDLMKDVQTGKRGALAEMLRRRGQ